MQQITDFSKLLQDYLEDRQIVRYKTSNLISAGENYGSLMLKVDIKVRNGKTGDEEEIYAVAKTPPTNEHSRQVFNMQESFKNEIAFYKVIFPLLRRFQDRHGMKPLKYFPEFLGGRLNLEDGDLVDDNAVLVLENLVANGFGTVNRYTGFDLETTKLIVKDLANFHATAIALKLEKPEEFNSKIKPYLDGVRMIHHSEPWFIEIILTNISKAFENKSIKPYKEKVFKILKIGDQYKIKEPWTTICHNDLWVNNTMVKFIDGKPIENKFVDFQVCRYHSAATDLIFFLLSSVQDDVITGNFDFFLKLYHREFSATLNALNCDVAQFSWESFENELLYAKNDQIRHLLIMMFPIFMDKNKAAEIKEDASPFSEPSERHVEKLIVVLELLEKKGWLD